MDFPFPIRKIIHVDMDAFYASVEQKDHPGLRGKPLAVGGDSERGVVAAASYEARKYGVRSAMAGRIAKQKCPELIFVKPRFERYKEISKTIRNIFFSYTDLVEPLALDEAYLDVTENKMSYPSATLLAQEIRQKIKKETDLNASAGISINKFLAKVASDLNKPNGQKTIPPEEVLDFMESLDIRKFHGIGKKTTEKMYRCGIFTGKDLKAKELEYLEENFGKSGRYYHDIVRGVQHSMVKPSRIAKSQGAERTFAENISSEVFLLDKLDSIAKELSKRLMASKIAGKTITLKIKYADFQIHTRSKTLPYFVADASVLLETAKELLYQQRLQKSVRLIGISVSKLNVGENRDEKKNTIIDPQLKLEF